MNHKFLPLVESMLTRYQRQGFLVGDVVKFVDGFVTKEFFKKCSDEMKQRIKEIADMGKEMNLKVVYIKNEYPSAQPGNENNTNGTVFIDIAIDYGGGRYFGTTTVSQDMLQRISSGVNLDPIPSAIKRDNMITLKPELVDIHKVADSGDPMLNLSNQLNAQQTRMTDAGNMKLKKTELDLAKKNKKIPAKGESESKDTNYYVKYMS
jgi:hypothetical protein